MRALLHIILPIAIIALGAWGYTELKGLKKEGYKLRKDPAKEQKRPVEQPKIRTRVMPMDLQDFTITLHSQGVVRPHNATTLTSQVSGRIVEITPSFEDGAYFSKGEILIKLDTADYLTDLESAKAQLARSEASFAQEQARAKQALLNWKDAGFEEEASDLVLRKPQLREAEANVNSAKSSLERAKRNLARTQVKAPYDGRVRKRNVGLGQQVGASTPLGEVFSTDFAEVRLPLTSRDLQYYNPPNKPEAVTNKDNIHFESILNQAEEHATPPWVGSIIRAEGELDTDSKQLFVIAKIDDPFGLNNGKAPLFIGQPVRASIPAKTLSDVYTVPRKHLKELNEILVLRNGLLKSVTITPIWTSAENIITREGIEPGDLLCTTRLPYAPEGVPVEIIEDAREDSSGEVSPTQQAQAGDSGKVGKKRTKPRR
ncbi:efflux RND transporter periplasmic adaptor subunit [Verrucomicrobiaceae bacterium N1E253]|uniref:Efflux RND transporter periplasmic adaptor subunit n=1 Tax=Oceaniferula marina TaxID=2748318 RepID=A0A851GAR6_9BACT|nr:efflux RND transporter periplasmic adaptor subunit [Oceaniferula marina]NWK54858.1 efflux RND transporter periplasmic adaptor subunit [Oceaniferula marina]